MVTHGINTEKYLGYSAGVKLEFCSVLSVTTAGDGDKVVIPLITEPTRPDVVCKRERKRKTTGRRGVREGKRRE